MTFRHLMMPQASYISCVVCKAVAFSLRLFESFTVIIFYSLGNEIFTRLKPNALNKQTNKKP